MANIENTKNNGQKQLCISFVCSFYFLGGRGRVPDSLQIIDNITSSAPAPIDNRRISLHALYIQVAVYMGAYIHVLRYSSCMEVVVHILWIWHRHKAYSSSNFLQNYEIWIIDFFKKLTTVLKRILAHIYTCTYVHVPNVYTCTCLFQHQRYIPCHPRTVDSCLIVLSQVYLPSTWPLMPISSHHVLEHKDLYQVLMERNNEDCDSNRWWLIES